MFAFHSLRRIVSPKGFLPLELNFNALPQNLTGWQSIDVIRTAVTRVGLPDFTTGMEL